MKKPSPWNGKCQRCGRETHSFTGSWFSTELICLGCSEIEEASDSIGIAKEAEEAAVRRGDLNFPGIGWPYPKGRVPRGEDGGDDR